MDNIYSAYHYACKTKADKEAVEQIYEEVKKSAQNAIFRNIGDIFFTARTDTEINGAVECNGGVYSTADFSGSQNIGNLLANGSLPYVSLSEYESIVSANGSCRAFGWDGGSEFRVPTIPALLLTKEQAAVVGNGSAMYFTSQNNSAQNTINGNYSFGNSNLSMLSLGTGGQVYNGQLKLTTDRLHSGIVANLDVIEYRAMVQLANGATDQAVITATSVLQQVANKVDKTSATDRETVVGWGMPDYDAGISIKTTLTSNVYEVPCKGVIRVTVDNSGGVVLEDENNKRLCYIDLENGVHISSDFYIEKSKKIKRSFSEGSWDCIFYPLKGVN